MLYRISLSRVWACYILLLGYSTWFPLGTWDWSLGGVHSFLAMDILERTTRSDFVINFIVYIPLGYLTVHLLRGNLLSRLIIAILLGCSLSVVLEFGQTFLPGRTTSLSDIILNTTGSLVGALLASVVTYAPPIQLIQSRLQASLRNDSVASLGLLSLAVWVLSQWAPFILSFDLANIRHGLTPLYNLLMGNTPFAAHQFIRYLLMLLGVCAVATAILKPAKINAVAIVFIVSVVLAGKVFIVGRVLAPEALVACLFVMPLLLVVHRLDTRLLRIFAAAFLLGFYAYSALQPHSVDTSLRTINWIPFRGHMNTLTGIMGILDTMWVFLALGYALFRQGKSRKIPTVVQGLLLLGFVSYLEWQQQFVAGRFPDITDVLVATGTWWFAVNYPWKNSNQTANQTRHPILSPAARKGLVYSLLVASSLIVLAVLIIDPPDKMNAYQLPPADLLPQPSLPTFRMDHPRLPAPTQEDIAVINHENPQFWQQHIKAGENGELYSRILMARVQPESVDLSTLYAALLQLTPSARGDEQTVPLALAYDWLHHNWTPQQRDALLEKIEIACQYQIDVIRNRDQLSPYNVELYNSPLQALVMAALVSYRDAADDSCMRFTADYWKNRVLPVWRQVMGDQGGWHEGGEYLGIGIGQAIYQLPALWRHATGEDLFISEAGIRGFLDFAVYRTRPDGTHQPHLEAAHVNHAIPDLAPLAIEFQHRAAYTLAVPPLKPTPTASPWGPLSQASLADPEALNALPLSRYFDGIGLLVARSDWSKNATYVTFKAGNNFWSHMHLDQGSFTIFKGGSLAIDSGRHETPSHSDHRMNYTHQSIAHNVVTVTDAEDTIPMPSEARGGKPRTIANDGGQRRIGSGWGRSAPLDYRHWKQQKSIYQTVGTVLHGNEKTLLWKVADLTPAYTNNASGKGTFANRTLRVKQYQRTFIYDLERDLVIVYDRMESTNPSFRKKWLLHSLHEPQIHDNGFEITTPPNPQTGMTGGRLTGKVLLPSQSELTKIGGPGFEFFVDGVNYDGDGVTPARGERRKEAETGSWRLEIQPAVQDKVHEFLVVMGAYSANNRATLPVIEMKQTTQNLILMVSGDSPLQIVIPRSLKPVQVRRDTL